MTRITEIIDSIPDDVLVHVIRNSNSFTWNFLAVKIILTRLNLKLAMYQNNDGILGQCCEELRDLLRKSVNIPNAQKDMQQIRSLVG